MALGEQTTVLQRLRLLGENNARRLWVVQALLDGSFDFFKVGLLEDVLLDGKVLGELEPAPTTIAGRSEHLGLLSSHLLQVQPSLLFLGTSILQQLRVTICTIV